MNAFEQLTERVEKLLHRYREVREENVRLKETLESQAETIRTLNESMAGLETQMIALTQENKQVAEAEKTEIREYVNRLIREIDSLIEQTDAS